MAGLSEEVGPHACPRPLLSPCRHHCPPNARRQLQAARNRRMGNHVRIDGAPTDSCTP